MSNHSDAESEATQAYSKFSDHVWEILQKYLTWDQMGPVDDDIEDEISQCWEQGMDPVVCAHRITDWESFQD